MRDQTKKSPSTPLSRPIQVLVVDDYPATRDALRRAIQAQSGMQIVGEAATYREALSLTCSLKPDVLVLDLDLPDGNGWTLLEQLGARDALPPALIFSGFPEEIYGQRLLRAGARGFLMKGETLDRVMAAIREVHAGYLVASTALSSRLMKQALDFEPPVAPTTSTPGLAQLSDRELQIFILLGQGLRNKEAASRLDLSEKTIATYKVRVMEKLGLRTTAELVHTFQGWRGARPATDPLA